METKRNSGRTGKAAELSERNQTRFRNLIKTAKIIEKLNNHILGKAKMTNTMVRAAEILLRKVQPDLLATAISDSRDTALPLLQIVRPSQPDSVSSSTDTRSGLPRSKVSAVPAADPAKPDPADAA